MTKLVDIDIGLLFNLLEKKATELEYDAGMAGEYGDRGARVLREKIKLVKDILAGNVPEDWEGFVKQMKLAEAMETEEYKQYIELKAKFGPLEEGAKQ